MAEFDHFDTFPGWVGVGGWGKIEIKDQLSLAEAEVRAELRKNIWLVKFCFLWKHPV